MESHREVANNDHEQADADNAFGSNAIREEAEDKLADGVEETVAKYDVGQPQAVHSCGSAEQRKCNAEIFTAKIEAGVGKPRNSKGSALSLGQIHSLALRTAVISSAVDG